MTKKQRKVARAHQNKINAAQGYGKVITWRDIEAEKMRKAQEEAIAKRMQEKADKILGNAGFFSGIDASHMASEVEFEVHMSISPHGKNVIRPIHTLEGECVEVNNEQVD